MNRRQNGGARNGTLTMPTPSPRLVLVEPKERDYLNVPLLEEFARAGLNVPQFESYAEMEQAGVPLAEVEVLVSLICSREIIERAPRLRGVVNPYTGSEHIDRAAANERGVIIGNCAAPENAISLSEATILLLLACFFNLAECERILREQAPRPTITAHMLMGKTIGLVGYGAISQGVAARLQGWGVNLLISAPRLHAPLPPGARHVELEELLAQSDAVIVLCNLNETTRNLLSRERLALMKPTAVLVNTARGGIVDESAVADMLSEGRLRKAAIDAFEIEPLPADSPLRHAPGAILTPHMIGHVVEAELAMARMAAESAMRLLRGQPPVHVFNPEVLPAWLARQEGVSG